MKNARKVVALLLLAALTFSLSGCTASYKQDFLQDPNYMSAQASVLIVTPKDGTYGEIYYETSGRDVVEALTKELRKYTTNVAVIPTNVSINDIADEDLQGFDYIFTPEILHWEDRLTGWSFRPDRIEVRFDIYNNQRQLTNSINIKGKSANIVWVSKAPKSLLPKPIRLMLQDLFR
ncbi:MAG: DUF4823 domain-containing protein [Fibrobacter sp.]|nr:DUF4823 domain-containing protein [Fibrobacter sp.]